MAGVFECKTHGVTLVQFDARRRQITVPPAARSVHCALLHVETPQAGEIPLRDEEGIQTNRVCTVEEVSG